MVQPPDTARHSQPLQGPGMFVPFVRRGGIKKSRGALASAAWVSKQRFKGAVAIQCEGGCDRARSGGAAEGSERSPDTFRCSLSAARHHRAAREGPRPLYGSSERAGRLAARRGLFRIGKLDYLRCLTSRCVPAAFQRRRRSTVATISTR
jgi:hypothetical protein